MKRSENSSPISDENGKISLRKNDTSEEGGNIERGAGRKEHKRNSPELGGAEQNMNFNGNNLHIL